MAAVAPAQTPVPGSQPRGHPHQAALPIYDLFLDLPHPAAASSCPPPAILGAPTSNPDMEKELSANLSRIGRFAFPEFDDAIAQNVPRQTNLNRFSYYAMQQKSFQHYTFSMQLQSGVRIHGHVRRYLPMHMLSKSRYDVGRRGERALVILTRSSGGDLVYSAILKTIDAISFQQCAMPQRKHPHTEPQKWFLHRLFDQHKILCGHFSTLPQHERKAMLLTVDCIEVGQKSIPLLEQVDAARYLLPTSLLSPTSSVVESVTSSSILPLLRVLGIQNTLRLISALLSESRVLMISSSPTRLAQSARSALSILAQGLLNWQHIFIPVLPPHLFQYLAAPVPYLIGMLTSLLPRLDQAKSDGLGEIVIINLDTVQMETRGINPAEVATRIPDLFRAALPDQGMPQGTVSATDMLAQDLVDLLKLDKRSLYGESALTNVSETAAKATKAVKTGIMKAVTKGKKFLKKKASNNVSGSASDDDGIEEENNGGPEAENNTLLPDFIYTQGAQNEVAEEAARIAFTSFFLSMFGNMRWYLSASPGKVPQLDRDRFLQQKRDVGEGEHTPIWPLLQNFCHTQMLEEFAKARVEEVRTRMPITADSPLFSQCANYHRLHSIDFSVVNVRRVASQVAQNNPSRSILQTPARRTAMLLTSNRTYEGDYNAAVAQLVEQCRECSSVLFDVMSVIWVRMRDSKGLHWKHGFQSLQILRNLLYHGPLAAIAEATDGLDKIRLMKFYNDNMRSQICTQIRQAANQVYNLLVDRAKLYNIRRLCINKRRLLRSPDKGRFMKEIRMNICSTPFVKMHAAFNPSSRSRIAPAPSSGPGVAAASQFAAEQDLLGLDSPAPVPPVAAPAAKSDPAQDMMGLFASVSVSNPSPAAANDPFSAPGPTESGGGSLSQPSLTQGQIQGAMPPPGSQGEEKPRSMSPKLPQHPSQPQPPAQYQPQPPNLYPAQQAGPQQQAAQLGATPAYNGIQPYQGNQAPVQGQPAQQYQAQAQGYQTHQNPNLPNQSYPPQQQYPAQGGYPPQQQQQQPVQGHPPQQQQPVQGYQTQQQQPVQGYPPQQQQPYHQPVQQAVYGAPTPHHPFQQQAQQQQQQYQQQQAYQQSAQQAPPASNVSKFDPFA